MKTLYIALICLSFASVSRAATYDIDLKVVESKKAPIMSDSTRTNCYADGSNLNCLQTSKAGAKSIMYTMLAKDSQGTEYTFGCEWHTFSKCQLLNAGESFRARMEHGKLIVECYDMNHKLKERKYEVYHIKVP